MEILKKIDEVQDFILNERRNGNKIGFVPTMGALHDGHISLIKESVKNNNITVSSIFVNPTQFNNSTDLEKYPRDLEKDIELLKNAGCNLVFTPEESEMYPEKDTRVFDFGGIESKMEGEFRPGHFNGVAQIVSKLFYAIPAHSAYFGEKDFQQLAIIKQLVIQESIPVNIVPCPTVREKDGLAMSSRNLRLTDEHRKIAPIIYEILNKAKELTKTELPSKIKEFVSTELSKEPLLKLEYFEIVDDTYLNLPNSFSENQRYIACIAVWAGDVRLIDNIEIK